MSSSAALFRALAHPARLRILDRLRLGERAAGALGAGEAMSQPALSVHLAVLRRARLVRVRREGRRRLYRIDPRGVERVGGWARRYERFWRARLGALREHLEGEGRDG